jgi:penicillin-binding protein 1A
MPQSSSHQQPRQPSEVRSNRRRKRSLWVSLFKWLAISGITLGIFCAIGVGLLYYKVKPDLPDVSQLREVQLQMPLRIYTEDGQLIAEYGEKRREPVQISAVPDDLKNAIIASEDARFYKHPGVDYQGIMRAVYFLVKTGEKGPGGSTITMQVARNFFLTNRKTYSRKINEIFLALKIESELEKDEILELYINKIYLGNRSYGFAAASKVYYGKQINDLELIEAAMLAGLPKAPSRYNPIVNPERALLRRDYVLRRMHEENMITAEQFAEAKAQPDTAELHYSRPEAEANYVGEMVRERIQQLYGDKWSTAGFNVFTTIQSDAQKNANAALRGALFDYEARHGYTGPIDRLEPEVMDDPELFEERLDELSDRGGMIPAAVIDVTDTSATVVNKEGERYIIPLDDVLWARERIELDKRGPEITAVTEVLAVGDVIHIRMREDGTAQFVQEPKVEGAFVALEPGSGEVLALVGGFDYFRSKFNRVTQARRQPGSTIKPFIYSAALHMGDTAATIYNDAPVVFHDPALEGEWRPQNYSGRFFGPTRLREALVKSRNLVSIRVLREITVESAIEYAQRFGFKPSSLPEDLSLALGNASITPMELSSGFAVFANGGYKVPAHFILRIEDPRGDTLYTAPEVVYCEDCLKDNDESLELLSEVDAVTEEDTAQAENTTEGDVEKVEQLAELDIVNAPRVIDARNAFVMNSIMRDVVRRGTARRAGEALGRSDLAGKTGTTNNQLDAWFAGYNSQVVAAAWIGSDGLTPLGRREAGGVAALPMWTAFMSKTLEGMPEDQIVTPEGLKTVRIDRKTGEAAITDDNILEFFIEGTEPEGANNRVISKRNSTGAVQSQVAAPRTKSQKKNEVEQLF